MKYAIMVCFDNQEDDWIYVTEQTENCWDLHPLLFDDIHDALAHARSFEIPNKEENVVVVSYE